MAEVEPLAIRPEDAAKLSGLGRTTIYQAISSGDLPSLKVGKRRLVRVEALKAWLARLECSSAA